MQDFALGVSLFLVTVTFVLGLFPGFLEPFTSGASGAEQAQADQVAGSLVIDLSTGDSKGTLRKNSLNATQLRGVLNKSQPELRQQFGLDSTTGVNITVRELDGDKIVEIDGDKLATAEDREKEPASSVGRIITLNNRTVDGKIDARKCRPGCRLVVKTW
uniref:DUF7287 family protein n=1 Tax=Halorientalis salina TaxID=2932266 RepID=UPI0010ACBECC|nr:hypothetical protein [Halorientalis salina]